MKIFFKTFFKALYGPKSAGSEGTDTKINSRTTAAPPGEEDQELCTDPKIDTMFDSAEGHSYAFKGSKLSSI